MSVQINTFLINCMPFFTLLPNKNITGRIKNTVIKSIFPHIINGAHVALTDFYETQYLVFTASCLIIIDHCPI